MIKNSFIKAKIKSFGAELNSLQKIENDFEYIWYVGYVETKDDVWFFAMNIDTKSKDDLPKRKAITLETLKLKGIIY